MQLVFIHGAWSSPKVFNYLIEQLKPESYMCLEHSTQERFSRNLDQMVQQLSKEPVFLIGHSLGGIYALHLSAQLSNQCAGGVTIATPYGGLFAASLIYLTFPNECIFRDLSTTSQVIRQNRQISIPKKWTQIVCKGSSVPWINEENDGVVSVSSQMQPAHMPKIVLNSGHHEVLQDPATVELINSQLKNL